MTSRNPSGPAATGTASSSWAASSRPTNRCSPAACSRPASTSAWKAATTASISTCCRRPPATKALTSTWARCCPPATAIPSTGEREVIEFNLDEGPAILGTTQEITPRAGSAARSRCRPSNFRPRRPRRWRHRRCSYAAATRSARRVSGQILRRHFAGCDRGNGDRRPRPRCRRLRRRVRPAGRRHDPGRCHDPGHACGRDDANARRRTRARA